MTARLIVIDDHPIVRQGLRAIVAADTGLQVVAEAADGVAAEALARETAAELMVLDVQLPRRSGIEVLQALRRDGISLPVLFYTMVPVAQYAAFLRRAGAQGIVGKDSDEPQVLQALRDVLAGGRVFPGHARAPRDAAARAAAVRALSPREAQVLQGLLQGRSLVEIAAEMGVGAPSVSTYRRRVLDKLDCSSNAELIRVMAP